ncbi:MAG: calcium-binding protein [Planctomycetota bacterium]|nr:calcium-binding protein [Planctomycetota bacterium]
MTTRLAFVVLLAGSAAAQNNAPVSVSSSGALANNNSYYSLISADGRYVVYQCEANNLTANDFNGQYDIYRRDLQAGVTELVSVGTGGNAGNSLSLSPALSGDGRLVVWSSNASNLIVGDTNGTWDIFLRDMTAGVTTRISLTGAGGQTALRSDQPRITPDGRYVTFESDADLIPGDPNGLKDCYRLDRSSGQLDLVSTSTGGTLGNSISYAAQPSDDGRYVCFFSVASNLVGGDTNAQGDVFWKDMQVGTLLRVNVSTAGNQANNESIWPSISGDGQTVTYCSVATNLVTGDTNGQWDLYARDISAGVTTRLNLQPNGAQADSYARSPSALTTDGRFVIYASLSTNLVPGDTNGFQDIFLRDRLLQTTERVSFDFNGLQTNSDNFVPHMTPDKRVITYTSTASNIVPNDTNGFRDIFASTLGGVGTAFCFGDGSATACPCGNVGAAGSGCANSVSGSGALLAGSGSASLGGDTLVLVGSGMPNSSALYFQGTSQLNGGAGSVFGDGLRCAGGTILRLGVKPNAGGSSQYPVGGDLPVSVRGLVTTPGTRTYQVWYRNAAAFCTASTFNLSNGLELQWNP